MDQLTLIESLSYLSALRYKWPDILTNPPLTQDAATALINQAQTALAQPPQRRTVTINAGTITIPHVDRFTIFEVENEGGTFNDTLSKIEQNTPGSYGQFDIIGITQKYQSQKITIDNTGTGAGLIRPNGGSVSVSGEGDVVFFFMRGEPGNYKWFELFRYPHTFDNRLSSGNYIIDSGEITITDDDAVLRVEGEYTGEVLATGTLELSTCATGVVLEAYINDGTGPRMIGRHTCGSGFPAFEVVLWRDAINAATATNGGYTATATTGATDLVTIFAPPGSGSTPNGVYQYYAGFGPGATGSPTAATFFGTVGDARNVDGVDGSPASDTLSTINSGAEGQLIQLTNAMTGDKYLKLDSAGNIGGTFFLAAGLSVWLMFNSSTSNWERIQNAYEHSRYYFIGNTSEPNYQPLNGGFDGVISVGPPVSDYNINGFDYPVLRTNQDDGIGLIGKVQPGAVDTEIDVIVSYFQTATDTDDFKLHVGVAQWANSSDLNQLATYQSQVVAFPGTSEQVESLTFTISFSSLSEGANLGIYIFRNGSSASDDSASNLGIVSVELRYNRNL